MTFFKKSRLRWLALLALVAPVMVYALAPVESVSQDQNQDQDNAQTSQVIPPPSPTAVPQSETNNTPLVDQNSMVGATASTSASDGAATAAPASSAASAGDSNAQMLSSLAALPESQRIARLEQQMQNMVQANMPEQISNVQQQIQQLSGELQVQQHDIDLLNQQIRNFYQDLSAQIKQAKNISAPVADDSSMDTTVSHSVAAHTSVVASNQYQTGLTLLAQKKYADALKSFQSYLKLSPRGQFVASAHYWMGEIYVQMKNLNAAATEFRIVIDRFAHSDKVADAQVKLAIIHASQGKTMQAKSEFMRIKSQYAGTTAAQLADIQLQQLSN